jgi:hypothetical protein
MLHNNPGEAWYYDLDLSGEKGLNNEHTENRVRSICDGLVLERRVKNDHEGARDVAQQ